MFLLNNKPIKTWKLHGYKTFVNYKNVNFATFNLLNRCKHNCKGSILAMCQSHHFWKRKNISKFSENTKLKIPVQILKMYTLDIILLECVKSLWEKNIYFKLFPTPTLDDFCRIVNTHTTRCLLWLDFCLFVVCVALKPSFYTLWPLTPCDTF